MIEATCSNLTTLFKKTQSAYNLQVMWLQPIHYLLNYSTPYRGRH